jgi:hypothetical protein
MHTTYYGLAPRASRVSRLKGAAATTTVATALCMLAPATPRLHMQTRCLGYISHITCSRGNCFDLNSPAIRITQASHGR